MEEELKKIGLENDFEEFWDLINDADDNFASEYISAISWWLGNSPLDIPDLNNFVAYLCVRMVKFSAENEDIHIQGILDYDSSDLDIMPYEKWCKVNKYKYFCAHYEKKIKFFEEKGFQMLDFSLVKNFADGIVKRFEKGL